MHSVSLKSFILEKRYHVARHVAFWLVTLPAIIVLHGASENNLWLALVLTFFTGPVSMLFTYAVISWLVPRFLVKARIAKFCLYLFLTGLVFQAILVLVNHFLVIPYITGVSSSELNFEFSEYFDWFKSLIGYIIAAVAVLIKIFKYWYNEQLEKQQAERERLSAELRLLKAELHPHFLFNTLNNLYTLVYERSEKAPQMVMRLSGLLSYVLYECKADEVSLSKEINSIRDYVELERERYGDRLDISISFSGETEEEMIVPLLFQPFIENAFKHGISEQLGKSWISIDLSVKKRRLVFKLINSYDRRSGSVAPGGIGISNVEKRLELLYPERHRLLYGLEGDAYVVSMQIELL